MPGVTDIVRFAPSACNTQPWLVERKGESLRVFRYQKPGRRGIMPAVRVAFYNQIGVGFFLCFLELCLKREKLEFSVELHPDHGSHQEQTLIAVYHLQAYGKVCDA